MLTLFNLGEIKQAYAVHKTIAGTARATGFSRSTIAAAVSRKFAMNEYKRAPKQSKVQICRRLKRLAKMTCKKEHRQWPKYSSARQLQAALHNETGIFLSTRSIQRNLREMGFRPFVRKPHPTRRRQDLIKKRDFARRHRDVDCQRIVFSDESWLCCNERTGRLHWAENSRDVLPLERKARWNVASIMVWGTVGHGFKGPLIVFPSKVSKEGELRQFRLDSEGYVRRCLATVVPTLVAEKRIFQQDGARSHVAKSTMDYLARKKVEVLADWPPYCPDLNAIERIWKELNARVGARCPMTVDELVKAAQEEWAALPQQLIDAHCAHLSTQLAGL